MWCFIDESWHEGMKEHVGVLAGAVGTQSDFDELGRVFYRVRKKYFGEVHARDLRSELKGKDLFSNLSFKRQKAGYSKNLSVVREILEWVNNSNVRFIGICIYGDTKPPLLTPHLKSLSTPFRELCVRVSAHVPANQTGQMIFDQRLGAQEEISVAVHNYLAGIRENKRLLPYPLIGVSNVWPGLQLADIVAYILGKYASGTSDSVFGIGRLSGCRPVGLTTVNSVYMACCGFNGLAMTNTSCAKSGQKNRTGTLLEGRVLRPGRSHSSSISTISEEIRNSRVFNGKREKICGISRQKLLCPGCSVTNDAKH